MSVLLRLYDSHHQLADWCKSFVAAIKSISDECTPEKQYFGGGTICVVRRPTDLIGDRLRWAGQGAAAWVSNRLPGVLVTAERAALCVNASNSLTGESAYPPLTQIMTCQ